MKYNKFMIKKVEHLNDLYFVLHIESEELCKITQPGQFYEILSPAQMLRIPISVFNAENGILSLMIKKIGEGTNALSKFIPGEMVNLIGPLGNTFSIHENKNVLLISGGIGYPPLFYLKRKLLEKGNTVFWIHGGRTKYDVFTADMIFTDDGSKGRKGFVTLGLKEKLKDKIDIIYTCGPNIMMKNIYKIASKENISVEVSLEEYMGCGIGACFGCVVQVKSADETLQYKRVCKDGPIFNASEVVWDE